MSYASRRLARIALHTLRSHERPWIGRQRPGHQDVEDAGPRHLRSTTVAARDGVLRGRECPESKVDLLHCPLELNRAENDIGDPVRADEPEEAVEVRAAQVEIDKSDIPTGSRFGDGQVGCGRRLALPLDGARDQDRPHVAAADAHEVEVRPQ